MLDIALTGVDNLLRRHTQRYMARERKILAAGLLRDGEKRSARRMVVDFDQIHSAALEQLNCRLPVHGGLHTHSERPVSGRVIENWSRRKDTRSEHAAGRGRFT